MNIQDIKNYLEKLDPTQILTLNDGEVSINRIYLDPIKDVYLVSNGSTKHTKVKDLLIQLEMIDPITAISFRDINEDDTMKDSLLKFKDEKLVTEKQFIHYDILFYYLSELDEDNELDEEEKLSFYFGKALESYFGIDELRFDKDAFIELKDITFSVNLNHIEIEAFKKYSLYTDNVNQKNLEKLREDLKEYVKTGDFSVFKYEGDFEVD